MTELVFDREQALTHAEFLHGELPGWCELRQLPSEREGRPRTSFHATATDLVRRVAAGAAWGARSNCYAGVATRARQAGSADDLLALRVLWGDFDGVNRYDRRALLRRLRKLPKPALVVFTGGGFHVYWLLAEPLDVRGHDGVALASHCLRGFVAYGADPACVDASRILRLAGTINWLDERKRAKGRVPARTEIEALHPERAVELREFERLFGRPTAADLATTRAKREPIEFAPKPSRRVRALAARNPWLRALVAREPQFPSESHLDFALARALFALGVDDVGEIAGALYASRADAGVGHKLDRPDYFTRTATRAVESMLATPWLHGRGGA